MMNPIHQELSDVIDYLTEHSKSDFKRMPEGSVAKVVNGLSPEAREAFVNQYAGHHIFHSSGGRLKPFEEKLPLVLPPAMDKTYQRIEDEQTVVGLHDRLGTPQAQESMRSELETSPPDRRETLSAAFDHHEGSDND